MFEKILTPMILVVPCYFIEKNYYDMTSVPVPGAEGLARHENPVNNYVNKPRDKSRQTELPGT